MAGTDIEKLIKQIAKLPSLGTRSARRIVLQLIKKKEQLFIPLVETMQQVITSVKTCEHCGNIDTTPICSICSSPSRASSVICVVQDVADLWAMERVSQFNGKYFVLGGVLSALDGVAPEDLNIEKLTKMVVSEDVKEVVLALPATVDGQMTSLYISSKLKNFNIKISTLAQGIPMGAELDYMDEGTLQLALNSRKII